MTDPLLTVDQVAELLAVDPETVRREVRRGRLVASKIGRRLRVDQVDLDAYQRAARVEPAAAAVSVPRPASSLPRRGAAGSVRAFVKQQQAQRPA